MLHHKYIHCFIFNKYLDSFINLEANIGIITPNNVYRIHSHNDNAGECPASNGLDIPKALRKIVANLKPKRCNAIM